MCAVVQTPGDRTRRSGWRENSMMACSGTCRGGAGDDGDGEILRQRRAWVYRQRQGQNCTKLSPIESILQYRFATPNSLKARPAPGCCVTARLCKPSTAIPFPLVAHDSRSVLAVKGPLCRFAPWTAPGRSEGDGCLRGKRGVWAGLAGPKGTFRPYQRLDSLPCGGYLRVFCLQKTSARRFIPETSSLPPPETPAG